MFGNGRPLTKKQLVRLWLGLTILAWATQVLFAQWGYGAEVATNTRIEIHTATDKGDITLSRGDAGKKSEVPASGERFISPRPMSAAGGTLEIRAEATVFGPEVRLKQIARWNSRDAAFFEQTGELVLTRIEARGPYHVIEIDHIRQALVDAGVNVGLVKFAGPMSCTVNRSDAKPDGDVALAKWIEAKEQKTMVAEGDHAAQKKGDITPFSATDDKKNDVALSPVRSLREIITTDLAARLNLPIDTLQITFNPKDERVLNLCEPQFRFTLEPQRIRNLGEVAWTLAVNSGDKTQRMILSANVRAWQTQTTVVRPVSARAPIGADDVAEQRTLIDRLPEEPLIRAEQAIGQQAARDLKPGMLLTGKMLESVPMARNGQLITVTSSQGAIRLKTVVRAMEAGSLGQRIKVKNETTKELFDVVLTGPQEAAM